MAIGLAVALALAVAYIVFLRVQLHRQSEIRRINRENTERDELVFRYGQLTREDFEFLGVGRADLMDMVGAVSYRALMTRWYGVRAEGHYIAQAMSDAKARG